MTPFTHKIDMASELCGELLSTGFGPFYGTAPAALSALHRELDRRVGVLTVAREDNAIGIAAGAALTGHHPVVLMRHQGLAPSMGVLASLVVPYRIPLLLVVEVDPVDAAEGGLLGRVTRPLLAGLGVELIEPAQGRPLAESVAAALDTVRDRTLPTVLLIPSTPFGPQR